MRFIEFKEAFEDNDVDIESLLQSEGLDIHHEFRIFNAKGLAKISTLDRCGCLSEVFLFFKSNSKNISKASIFRSLQRSECRRYWYSDGNSDAGVTIDADIFSCITDNEITPIGTISLFIFKPSGFSQKVFYSLDEAVESLTNDSLI